MRNLSFLIAIFCFLLLAVITAPSEAAFDSAKFNTSTEPLKVLSVTPTGTDVPASRQMVFNFNRPVVPLGRMERNDEEIPITITPHLECQWRWLDTSSLACQLGDKQRMKPATRYIVVMEPGISAEDGSTIATTLTHSFITQRARITYTSFDTWRSPGMPSLYVNFNQDVDGASLGEHLYLMVNSYEVVALNVEETFNYNKKKMPRRWKVSPVKELPLDAEITLHVEPGILSLEGPERGVEKRLLVKFHTFPEFEFLGISCTKDGFLRDYKPIMIKAGEG
ncbi:MAG: large extracellular alpha-helical protein, partial [Deltaproteobacteria bacterium]|nr:large extracellular alpha-helical protein [Deltaproteobacteria bacterium]